jgi:hypothetical protein
MTNKTKTFEFVSSGNGFLSIAILNWGRETNTFTDPIKKHYVFAKYVYAYNQDSFEGDTVPNELIKVMSDYCKSKGLILYSY